MYLEEEAKAVEGGAEVAEDPQRAALLDRLRVGPPDDAQVLFQVPAQGCEVREMSGSVCMCVCVRKWVWEWK
jgi:hypothetical protein